MMNTWKMSPIYGQMKELKTLHHESQTESIFGDALQNYLKDSVTEKGSVLFAVYRGNASEGMDYPGNSLI